YMQIFQEKLQTESELKALQRQVEELQKAQQAERKKRLEDQQRISQTFTALGEEISEAKGKIPVNRNYTGIEVDRDYGQEVDKKKKASELKSPMVSWNPWDRK